MDFWNSISSGTQAGSELSRATTMLQIIEVVFVVTFVISLLFGLILLVWSLAKWNERSATRDLVKQIIMETRNTADTTFNVTEESLQKMIMQALSQVQNPQVVLTSPVQDSIPGEFPVSLPQPDQVYEPNQSSGSSSMAEANTLFRAGNVSLRYGDFGAAVREYAHAIRIAPEFAEAYNARGMAYRKIADLQKALQDYTMALNLNPQLAAAYNNRGIVYKEIRQFESALSDFGNAIDLEPKNAYGYCNRAIIYNIMGEFSRSLLDSSRAIEIDSSFAVAYVTRGISKTYLGSEADAREDFSIAESLGYEKSEIGYKIDSRR